MINYLLNEDGHGRIQALKLFVENTHIKGKKHSYFPQCFDT